MMSMHGITNICDYIFTKQNSSAKYHPAKNTAYYNTLFTLMCCKRQIFCGAKVLKFSMQHAKLPIFLKIYTL